MKIYDWYEIYDDNIGDSHELGFEVDTENRDAAFVYLDGKYLEDNATHEELLRSLDIELPDHCKSRLQVKVPYAVGDIIDDEIRIALIEGIENMSNSDLLPYLNADKVYTYDFFSNMITRIA